MSQIDAIDERILAELQENGRLTMKSLAERVGLSSPAMIERVRRLEVRRVISTYRAIVDPKELGRTWTAHIAAKVEHEDQEAFLNAAKADPAITECHRVTGPFTHFLRAHLADSNDLVALLDRLSETGADVESSIVLDSPIPWRAVTPPNSPGQDRARPTRRRRKLNAAAEEPSSEDATAEEQPVKQRRPGRPRGRRPAAAES